MSSMTDFLQQNGINIIPDFKDKIQRIKRKGNKGKDTWIFSNEYGDFKVIVFGDWSTSERELWTNKDENSLSEKDRRNFLIAKETAREKSENDRKQKQNLASQNAQQIFAMQDSQESFQYLEKKQIAKSPGTIFVNEQFEKFFAVPIYDHSGKIVNAQKILPNGMKLFLPGAKVKGCYYKFTGKNQSVAFIGEGYATCWTVSQCVDGDVYCAFNVNNIEDVYKTIQDNYNQFYIIVDDDRFKGQNAGKENGHKLRSKYKNISLIVPQFNDDKKGTDFNDMYLEKGFFEVKKCIDNQINQYKDIVSRSHKAEIVFDMVDCSDKGNPLATIDNFKNLLDSIGITIRYNIIKKDHEIIIPNEKFTIDNKDNASIAYIESWCHKINMPIGSVNGFITYLADKNIYNPVATWIESVPWDGKRRLDDLFNTVVAFDEKKQESKTKYLKEVLIKKWLISAVAAAYNPNGVSTHGVLVFQGGQYLGKTKWFLSLVPKEKDLIMQSCILRPDDRDSVKQAVSNWLVELGELDATFKKSDIAMLKGFLTKSEDVLRLPFAKKDSRFARRTVFFGSVNPQNYLNDPTGNRRFWTISCEKINYDHKIDMQQLWAEIYQDHYIKGESYYLNDEEHSLLNDHNKDFEALSFIEESIRSKFDWSKINSSQAKWMTTTEVLEKICIEKPSKADLNEASRVIRALNGNVFDKKTKGLLLKIPPN